jgi:hypothetical protein
MTLQRVPVSKLRANPKNPRIIKDEKFQKLVQSIKDFPEMLELRPIVVDGDWMVLGGNMRLKACQAAGLKEVPVAIAADLTPDQQREFIIKDNVGFGEWEWNALANEWDAETLDKWGLDVPEMIDEAEEGDEIEFPQSVQLAPTQEYIVLVAEPNSTEWDDLKGAFALGMVRRGGYKAGSPFEATGVERVLRWTEARRRLMEAANVNRDT